MISFIFQIKRELKLFKSCFGNFLSFIFMWTLKMLSFFLKRVCSKASLNFLEFGVNFWLVGPEASLKGSEDWTHPQSNSRLKSQMVGSMSEGPRY